VTSAASADILAQWTLTVQTRDGLSVCIRPLRPDDRQREIEFINSLSERSRYFRLMAPLKFLPPHLLEQLMDIDYGRRMALVATVERGGVEQFVAVARYGATDRPDTAELGITVTDAWQRRGIARLLVAELIRYARSQGFRALTGLVLPENFRMLALAKSLGFTSSYDPAEHAMRISLDLGC
jgi:RimJ/RimL family protein N-acetyltransferase